MKRRIIALLALVLLAYVLTGCQKETPSQQVADNAAAADAAASLTDDLAKVKEQSDAIRTSLEKDILTQTDMNLKTKELCDLWDGALTRLLEEAETALPEAEWTQLTAEQTAWDADKATAVEAAGKAFEGGSMYALVVNTENA